MMNNISKINLKGTSYDIKDKLVRDSIGVPSSETSLGIAPLDASGKVPSENLPSYVDDVIEGYYNNGAFYNEQALTTQITPETGKIYVDKSTNKTYRYGSSLYVIVSNGDGAITTTINKTWAQLKAMRDGGTLVPGQFYRITDYVTTTVQAETQSAGHQFDVIVCADSASTLSETAYAARHDGDTYFQNAKLEAWLLKYCLDNSTARFTWADSTNGKGVIYWMKDEWNNEMPFDFKNIQFKRYKITATLLTVGGNETLADLKDSYLGFRLLVQSGIGNLFPQDCTISTSDTRWSFALSLNGTEDLTLQANHRCTDNVVEPCFFTSTQYLNNVTMQATSAYVDSYNNHIDGTSHSISMGSGCYNNILSSSSYVTTLTSNSHDNALLNSPSNVLALSASNTLSSSGDNILSMSSKNTLTGGSGTNTLSGSSANNILSGSSFNNLSNSESNTLSNSGYNTLSSNFFAELIGCTYAVLPEGSTYELGIGGYMVEEGLYIKNYGQKRTVLVFLAEFGKEDAAVLGETITLEAGLVYYRANTYFEPSDNSQMTFTEGGKTHKYGFNYY